MWGKRRRAPYRCFPFLHIPAKAEKCCCWLMWLSLHIRLLGNGVKLVAGWGLGSAGCCKELGNEGKLRGGEKMEKWREGERSEEKEIEYEGEVAEIVGIIQIFHPIWIPTWKPGIWRALKKKSHQMDWESSKVLLNFPTLSDQNCSSPGPNKETLGVKDRQNLALSFCTSIWLQNSGCRLAGIKSLGFLSFLV